MPVNKAVTLPSIAGINSRIIELLINNIQTKMFIPQIAIAAIKIPKSFKSLTPNQMVILPCVNSSNRNADGK